MKKLTYFITILLIIILAACANLSEQNKEKASNDLITTDSFAAYSEAPSDYTTDQDVANEETEKEKPQAANKKSEAGAGGGANNQPVAQQNKPNPQSYYDTAFIKRNSARKLIKTANLNFKVDNVENASQEVENITNRFGGFVLSSSINNNITYSYENRVSRDSVMLVNVYSITNNMTIRVPEFYFDSALYSISEIWTQLNERIVSVNDVTVQFIINDMKAKLYQKTSSKINKAVDKSNDDLYSIVEAEKVATQYMENTIQKQSENIELQDKIDFSTITLSFRQDNVLTKTMIASVDTKQYEPGFWSEFVDSLEFGWKILMGFILFLVKIWSIILILLLNIFIIFKIIKYFVQRAKNRKQEKK